MARDPGSTWKPLPEAGAPDGHTKTQFIVHSTGTMGSAAANWNYFARGDVVVESTFIIGLTAADPTLQIMDSTDLADANGSANRRGISVEVVGDGVGPYTAWQIGELIRIGRWAAATHPIERRIIPSEAASGFGWHVMFGAPGPWTSVRGKVCPGNARVEQLKSTVFPAIFGASATQEDDMYGQRERDEAIGRMDKIISKLEGMAGVPSAVAGIQIAVSDPTAGLLVRTAKLEGIVAGLVAAVGQVQGGTGLDAGAVSAAAEQGAQAALDRLGDALKGS